MEVAPSAQPPVARIIDFQKFRYQETKKEQAAKKHTREGELKEIWLSPRIAQNDLRVRLKKIEEFLKENNKVKLTVKFKGREMAHQEVGHRVLDESLKVLQTVLGERVVIERDRKMEGRSLTIILGMGKAVSKKGGSQEESYGQKESQNQT